MERHVLVSYNARTGGTRWTARAPVVAGLAVDPHGNTVLAGGRRTAAYSGRGRHRGVDDRLLRRSRRDRAQSGWHPPLETGWASRGITTVAYHT